MATETTKPAPIISAFHTDFMAKLETGHKARDTMRAALCNLLKSRSKEMPTNDTWRNDRAALTQIAKDKGLSERTDYHLMEYTLAVRALYDATPVDMSNEAKRKRRERIAAISPQAVQAFDKTLADATQAGKPAYVAEALAQAAAVKLKGKKIQAAPGAPANVPQTHVTPLPESVEQCITRFGLFECLEAIARIVAADRSTEIQGVTLNAVANQLRLAMRRADVTPPPTAPAASAKPKRTRKSA